MTEPAPVPTATTPVTVDTSTLPTAPEPTTTAPAKPTGPKNGRFVWPRNENGWTIVLVSYPKTNGRPAALQTADKGARSGLHQVGVLDSSLYASLQPGYYVVFSGVYACQGRRRRSGRDGPPGGLRRRLFAANRPLSGDRV